MITHEDVAVAHQRAKQLDDAVQAAQKSADKPQASVFTRAYAEAKRQEARDATVTAAALARWASWRPVGCPTSNRPSSQVEAMRPPIARDDTTANVQAQDMAKWVLPSFEEIRARLKGVRRKGSVVQIPILGRVS